MSITLLLIAPKKKIWLNQQNFDKLLLLYGQQNVLLIPPNIYLALTKHVSDAAKYFVDLTKFIW